MTTKKSWVAVATNSDFPLQNIPFGVFRHAGQSPHLATRIGDTVIDLAICAEKGFFDDICPDKSVFYQKSLNAFMALGKKITCAIRTKIMEIFAENYPQKDQLHTALYPLAEVEILMPIEIPNYTDFYSSMQHATNVGMMFRDPANALLPNWKHLPVAYHGRASSIMPSGTPVRRPKGQTKNENQASPIFEPCQRLDFELEMAFVIGKGNELGQNISTAEAEEHIFGFLLFNDWSARDIQQWEYVPLGPFLSKNFISSVSLWVVTLEALDIFRVENPTPQENVLPYLQFEGKHHFDIQLEVYLKSAKGEPLKICQSNYKYLYWNICQQLAHHTVGGCNMQVGDLCASGTISGEQADAFGSMLELTWKGTKPIVLPDGSTRKFLQDYDTVIMKAFGEKDGLRIGFGEVSGQILPAL